MGDKTRGSSGHDPLLGKTFADRYRVERRLGQGGMGVVYAARQLSMDRVVALKVLSAELGASDAARARFVREMRATSKVEHANTVRVYDFGEDGEGHLFLTMELLDGRSLQQELSQRGAFETGRVLRIGESIARALAAAHGEGIVHRDLKPENVMLVDRYGERDGVKVLDFGIARILDGDTSDAVTRTGSLIGTPLYMAPEAALGKKVDHRADLYALGVVLYQMVSGRVPFSDAMPVRVLFMHANDTVPPLAEVAPGRASPPLEALILGLLAKSPDDRPQSATEVASVLRALSDAPTVEGLDADAVSRLAGDEAAMAKARALHADPALAVGTVRDEDAVRTPPVTVLVGADVGAATMADGLTPVMTAVESAMTAETMAGVAEAAAKGPEVSIAVDGEQDVDAPTLLPETIALSGDDVANLAPPAATAAATAPAEDSEASAAPAEMTPAQASGGVGRGVGIAVAALAVIGGAVLALRSAPPAPPPSTPATAEKSSDEPQSVAAETDAAPAPVAPGVDRSALDAATAAAGLPLPEVACRAREAAEVEQLRGALAGLVGAHPQRRGDGDRAAVAALAKATSPEADAIAAWAMLAAGEGHVGVAQRAQRGLTACAGTPLALRVLGIVHMQGGRWDRAQELLAKAHALAPKDVDTAYRLGVAELGRREPKAAAAAFEAALALDPQHLDAALGLGRARLADKDAAGAIAMLQPLTARAADRGDIWFFLAAAQAASGDADAARATFCKAAKAGYAPARARCPDAAPTAPPVH